MEYFILQKFWKLSLILLLAESYSNFIILNKGTFENKLNETVSLVLQSEVYLDDLRFYKVVLMVLLQTLSFTLLIHIFTQIYSFYNKQPNIPFSLVLKTTTLSNCSIFLTLPALIWDINVYNIHSFFIFIYSSLSQFISYRGKFLKLYHIDYLILLKFQLYPIRVNYGVSW